jgi:hypothetical protein
MGISPNEFRTLDRKCIDSTIIFMGTNLAEVLNLPQFAP